MDVSSFTLYVIAEKLEAAYLGWLWLGSSNRVRQNDSLHSWGWRCCFTVVTRGQLDWGLSFLQCELSTGLPRYLQAISVDSPQIKCSKRESKPEYAMAFKNYYYCFSLDWQGLMKPRLALNSLYYIYVVCTCAIHVWYYIWHRSAIVCVEVRGQLIEINSLLLPCGSQGLNSDCLVW